jgi:hypothetical protein
MSASACRALKSPGTAWSSVAMHARTIACTDEQHAAMTAPITSTNALPAVHKQELAVQSPDQHYRSNNQVNVIKLVTTVEKRVQHLKLTLAAYL